MNQSPLTLDQRIRNLEKALLSFIILSTSLSTITNPSSIPKFLGTYGVIVYLVMFLLSYALTIYYSMFIGISIAFDAANKIIAFAVKNKKIVASVLFIFLILTGVIVLIHLDYTLKQIISAVVLALLISAITNYKKIFNFTCENISKIEISKDKEDTK